MIGSKESIPSRITLGRIPRRDSLHEVFCPGRQVGGVDKRAVSGAGLLEFKSWLCLLLV